MHYGKALYVEFNLFFRSRVCSSEPGAAVHPWRVLWRPYMHHFPRKLRLFAALQPADSTYPPGYTGADQTPKFVVII